MSSGTGRDIVVVMPTKPGAPGSPAFRRQFSLPPGLHYLNWAYMAPLPRQVEAAGIRGMRRKRDPSLVGPDAFFLESDRVRAAFAETLGAGIPDAPVVEAERVAILPSVSYGVAICARNAGLGAGDEVVIPRDQFPGNVYGWMRAAAEAGARVRIVDPPPRPSGSVQVSSAGQGRGPGWNERLLEAIGPRTRVVSLGHVHWADGTLFDLAAIGDRAREVGALLVVDGTQSVGALPFPFGAARPDAVIVAAYKWLLGPYSLAFGWFGPAFDDGVPLEESWIAREGSRDFGGLVNYRDSYEPGAVRYDVGERSNPILLPMALAALELLDGWGGPAEVERHARSVSARFVAWAGASGFGVEEAGARASHLFGLRLPPGMSRDAVIQALAAQRVSVSLRGEALRISPHLHNDESDFEALRRALEGAARRRGLRTGASES
ncbi:MAG: aminotransferase class V-fold PLP-dependent enzyme [Gemmatimonadales bacterium]|nr:MAG: aminotransferase class V-fold PLP-dependent enzyme [Gemmatimonadales bacterium]